MANENTDRVDDIVVTIPKDTVVLGIAKFRDKIIIATEDGPYIVEDPPSRTKNVQSK